MLVLAGKRNKVLVAQHSIIISPACRPLLNGANLRIISLPAACSGDCRIRQNSQQNARATGAFMQATGELIRLLNYVDDISATLRRIHTSLPTLNGEERKRLAEYMRKADPNYMAILEVLEGGK